MLDGHPTKFAPGERFSYCNGGYVLLALLAERASGVPFHELVGAARLRAGRDARHRRSCAPTSCPSGRRSATSQPTGSARTSSTCRCAAPATAASTRRRRTSGLLWTAFFGGRIVSDEWVEEMTRPRSDATERRSDTGSASGSTQSTETVILEGYDAGVSFRSLHDPRADMTCTVISNWTDGAWPIAKRLAEGLQL